VNEAARLCDLAKGSPERVLASERAVQAAGSAVDGEWELGEQVTLRGRAGETRLAAPAKGASASA
jgi:adenylate cyclase